MRKKKRKPHVFCIGWHKTGTTTIGLALLKLGYSVVGARLDMAKPLLNGDYNTPVIEAGKYDAVQDIPWAALFKYLDKFYPNSKFILTIRNEQDWLRSAVKHFGGLDIELHKWLYGSGKILGNENLYMEKYISHNKSVLKYFEDRSSDLLVWDLTKQPKWEILCTFLGEPIPKISFPYENKAYYHYTWKDKSMTLLRRLIPKWIRKIRVHILVMLNLHYGRNRFNNKYD